MFILFIFTAYVRRNIREVTYSCLCILLHYNITREMQWYVEDNRITKKIRLEETSRGHLDFTAGFIANGFIICVMKT